MNTNLTNSVNNSPPSLTVVAYFGTTAPAGWQLCDGLPLMSMETPPQPVHYTINSAIKVLNTPNLLGRFILGASDIGSDPQISTGITKLKVGASGGEEKHKLSVEDIPAHNHGFRNPMMSFIQGGGGGFGGGGFPFGIYNDTAVSGGLDQPHNNMPPFYTLIYIIKKPALGGATRPVAQPSPLFT
jgi:microcystin-dependent protein